MSVASLHVELVGERTDAPPVLIAHGGPGLHHGIYRPLDPLAIGRRLVFWDHRGHGRSGPLPEGPTSMSVFADDALHVADQLDIDRFIMFGHSFGGWVAQELTLQHPERVAALILAATTPGQLGESESPDDEQGPPPPDDVAALLSTQPRTAEDVIETYTALAPHLLGSADTRGFVAELQRDLVSAEGMVRVFDALSRWSSVDRLNEIVCPTLVLAGRHDVFCSTQQLARIATRIPSAEYVEFESAGHFMWEEDPDAFFPLVSGWLDRHS